jgi:hypothetical protein
MARQTTALGVARNRGSAVRRFATVNLGRSRPTQRDNHNVIQRNGIKK